MLSASSHIRKKENIVCETLGSDAVLLNLTTGDYFTLNATGRSVWNILDEESVPDRIVDKALQSLNAEPEKVKQDVLAFLETLCRLELCAASS